MRSSSPHREIRRLIADSFDPNNGRFALINGVYGLGQTAEVKPRVERCSTQSYLRSHHTSQLTSEQHLQFHGLSLQTFLIMTSQYLTQLFTLSGKTAIVTGGTGGLGLDMTVALAEAGADIVSIQLANDPRADLLSQACKSAGRKLTVFECDVADSKSLRECFARIWEAGVTPDILLNCAGINRRGKVEDLSDEDIDAVFAINLKASYVAAQELGKRLLHLNRPGKIINVASIISFIANINISAYACTKGGVLQMTKAFSNEWASKGIQVNCICPG